MINFKHGKRVMALALSATLILSSGSIAFAEESNSNPTNYAEQLAGIFNAEEYAQMYPDVVEALGDDPEVLYQHFLMFGINETRNPSKSFDVKAYKSAYPDLKRAFGQDVLEYYLHYATLGQEEKRTITTVEAAARSGIIVTGFNDVPVKDSVKLVEEHKAQEEKHYQEIVDRLNRGEVIEKPVRETQEEIDKDLLCSQDKHTWGPMQVLISPTCEKDGLAGVTCTWCGTGKKDSFIRIDPTGHVVEEGSIVDGTENSHATMTGTCVVCGKEAVTQIKSEHTYVRDESKDIPADHYYNRQDAYTCSICGYTKLDEIPYTKGEHEFSLWEITSKADHYNAGTKYPKCACGYVDYMTEVTIPKLDGHNFDVSKGAYLDKIEEGTCTTPTKYEIICPCGERSGQYVERITKNHQYIDSTIPATCTEDGQAVQTCSVCGHTESYFSGEAALGHDFGDNGKTCSRCGIENTDYVEPSKDNTEETEQNTNPTEENNESESESETETE